MTAAARPPEDLLREASLRVTRPRVAVLTAVARHPHADTETIAGVVRRRLGKVSTQAVYDVLKVLTAAGVVRRFEPAGSPARYEARGDDHDHAVCRTCGAIADVDAAVGQSSRLESGDAGGYAIDAVEVIYWGLCPACASR